MSTNQKLDDAFVGRVFTKVEGGEDCNLLRFTRDDGKVFEFYHERDCCEHVYIESIVGDLQDLVGAHILLAEEVTNAMDTWHNPDDRPSGADESWTWTFYKFATLKGYVDVRWFGTSNGYYSEGVDLVERTA